MLNLEQLLRIPNVDTGLRFSISPDEKEVVFSWNKSGKWELWKCGVHELAHASQTASCLTPKIEGSKFSPKH